MTDQDTIASEVEGDPSDTDIEQLTAPLAPDDDVAERIDLCNKEYPAILEDAPDDEPAV